MISFDFMHSARPDWLRGLIEIRVPHRLYNALSGVAAALAIVAGAWTIEHHRFSDARAMEAAYQRRFDSSERALQKTKIFYDQVQALTALDRHVRRIVASGDADARRLAEIANNLPEHAWLTSISRDQNGVALEGRAQNLGVISGVLHGLMRARTLRNPILTSAQAVAEPTHEGIIKYAVRLEGTP